MVNRSVSKDDFVDVISLFQESINRNEILPEDSLRRNSLYYPLVSLVNHVTGLYLSKNYDSIPLFLDRIVRILDMEKLNDATYNCLVESYVLTMMLFLKRYSNVDFENHIPDISETLKRMDEIRGNDIFFLSEKKKNLKSLIGSFKNHS